MKRSGDSQSRRHGEASGGFTPQTKLQAPQNWNMKHYESVEFLSIFECQAPLHKRKAPLLKTFWRRSGDSTSVDMDTIFWAGIQLLDGQQEAPVNTVFAQHPPKLFTRNPAIYFPEVDKTCAYTFGMLPGFQGFLVYSATAAAKTALGVIQFWFNYFRGILALFLGDCAKRCRGSWFIHSCLVAILRGAWVGHAPPVFACPPFGPPSFFLISRLSSFGWHQWRSQPKNLREGKKFWGGQNVWF